LKRKKGSKKGVLFKEKGERKRQKGGGRRPWGEGRGYHTKEKNIEREKIAKGKGALCSWEKDEKGTLPKGGKKRKGA